MLLCNRDSSIQPRRIANQTVEVDEVHPRVVNGFNTAYCPSEVWGNFSYTSNSAPLYVGGSGLLVKRNFSYSLSGANQIQAGALTVTGSSNIS